MAAGQSPVRAQPEVRETHSSLIFLVGDGAYKVKKPIDLGFADFRQVEQRKLACRRELDLNRRLAPNVYLDVLEVHDAQGETYDHVLHMRRMPEALSLRSIVLSGQPVDEHLRSVARLMASFHASAATGPEIAARGLAPALQRRWRDILGTARSLHSVHLPVELLDEVEYLAGRFLDGRAELLAQRAERGLIRDGHGDLLAADIYCLGAGVEVLDCLDFDDRLRCLDVLDDVAFLAMDLEFLGRPDSARAFLDWYLEFSGSPTVASLEHHYIGYRATVRAAVSGIAEAESLPHAGTEAGALLDLALRHLRAGVVRLIVVGGPPGSGKSTLAKTLADQLGGVLIQSDVVRQRLVAPGDDRYSAAAKARVYTEMLDEARSCLTFGESVILDATWSSAADRERAREVADQTCSDLVSMLCQAPPATSVERVRQRRAAGGDESEADEAIADALASGFDPWPNARPVDTSGSAQRALSQALGLIRAQPRRGGRLPSQRR